MILVAATPHHAEAMALIHAAAFPPRERWGPDAIALQLALPGAYGVLALLPPSWDAGRGEGGRKDAVLPGRTGCELGDEGASLPARPSPHLERPGGFVLARVAADEAEVLTLAVTPAAQNRGCGGRLLRAAMGGAAAQGAGAMFLEVSPGNAPALAIYARAGFAAVGRRPRYYPGGGAALVLRCPLSRGAAAAGASRPPGA